MDCVRLGAIVWTVVLSFILWNSPCQIVETNPDLSSVHRYWVWRAINIYMVGCVTFYFNRLFGKVVQCVCCVPCGATCFYYQDTKFPANARSLGKLDGKTQHQLEQEYKWIRAGDLFQGQEPMGVSSCCERQDGRPTGSKKLPLGLHAQCSSGSLSRESRAC